MIGANYATQPAQDPLCLFLRLPRTATQRRLARPHHRRRGRRLFQRFHIEPAHLERLSAGSAFEPLRRGFLHQYRRGRFQKVPRTPNPTTLLSVEGFPGADQYNSAPFSPTCADHTEALVTYAKADSSGFTIFNIVPYSNIFSGLPQLAIITLLAGILVLGIGMFISFRTSAALTQSKCSTTTMSKSPPATTTAMSSTSSARHFRYVYEKPIAGARPHLLVFRFQKAQHSATSARRMRPDPELHRGLPKLRHRPHRAVSTVSSWSVQPQGYFGPDDPNYSFTATLSKTSPPKFLGRFGGVVTYRNSLNFLVLLLPWKRLSGKACAGA